MQQRMKLVLVAGAVTLAAGGIGTAAVGANSNDDQEAPITGTALDRAGEAALAHTGGGRVTDAEVGDEESHYEVEVTLEDATVVDVQLDESFAVVGDEADGPDDADDEQDADAS